MTLRQKAERLLELHHQDDPLVLVNAWDAASARIVEEAGFPAIATTSSGVANSLGYPDGEQVPPGEMLAAIRRMVRCVQMPVTADVEAGYGDPVSVTVALIEAGAVGLNIEDFVGNSLQPIGSQAATIGLVRETADGLGVPLVINARCDIYLNKVGEEETRFDRTVERLRAYADAGASCLFVPGVTDASLIGSLVQVSPLPLNILAVKGSPTVSELKSLGVKRISVGGGPMRAAMGLTKRIAESIRDTGTYTGFLDGMMTGGEANALFEGLPRP